MRSDYEEQLVLSQFQALERMQKQLVVRLHAILVHAIGCLRKQHLKMLRKTWVIGNGRHSLPVQTFKISFLQQCILLGQKSLWDLLKPIPSTNNNELFELFSWPSPLTAHSMINCASHPGLISLLLITPYPISACNGHLMQPHTHIQIHTWIYVHYTVCGCDRFKSIWWTQESESVTSSSAKMVLWRTR